MIFKHMFLIQFLLWLSVISFIFAIIYFVKQLSGHKRKSINQKLFIPTCCLVISIFLHRYIVGFYEVILSNSESLINTGYSRIDEVFNSLIRTMQTFSLDENYFGSIVIGKKLFFNEFNSRFLSEFYGLFASVLNICAPIISGAIILGILTSLFPRMKLFFMPFREKYVFSELNDRAICLAEDIIKETGNNKKQPLIIFTDAYIDYNSEAISELLQRAKDIGAICIKDDLLEISFLYVKDLHFILIDKEDINNIHSLIALVTENIERFKNKCHIYVFSQNPEASSIVKKLIKDYNLETSEIIIKLIQEYTGIVYNLFNDVPLYYPLLAKGLSNYSEKKELIVTIIGGGKIGMEVFLGTYWCAQMLDCKLRINVITKKAKKFKAKINYINREILLSGVDRQEFLRVFPNQDIYAEPYASFSFYSTDVESDGLFSILDKKDTTGFSLLLSDYFIIALGTDNLNITTADNLDRKIRREALNERRDLNELINKKPVIAYSVYDSKINEELNKTNSQDDYTYLHAFASLKKIYSCKNIFMNNVKELAYDINKKHNKTDEAKFLKDEYNWWSSIARTFHLNYKVFSIFELLESTKKHKDVTEEERKKYWEIVHEKEAINIRLSWLEHRRWNAFMRTKGFTAPTPSQWEQYAFKNDNDHKNIPLKLHPCIVESSETSQITINDWNDPNYENNKKLDCLDIASIKVYQTKKIRKGIDEEENRNFKEYDKPDKHGGY